MQEAPDLLVPLVGRHGNVRGYAKIDAADARLARDRWTLNNNGYARRSGSGAVLMHRLILGLEPGDGIEGDHINRDRLDNRRSNLRRVDRHQQTQNLSAHAGSTSRFRGVSYVPPGRWRARTATRKRTYNLGYFATEEAAAAAVEAFRAAHLPDVTPDPHLAL